MRDWKAERRERAKIRQELRDPQTRMRSARQMLVNKARIETGETYRSQARRRFR